MTQQPESVDWFAACREASAYAFTLKAELRSVEEKNRLLHQRHHDDNVEYMRVLTQRDALLEACKVALGIIGFGVEHDQISAAIKAAEETK
jgi:hypothetical protein